MKEYIVISRTNGVTKQGSPFATLKVADLEEKTTITVWDLKKEAGPQAGQKVKFRSLRDYQGKKSASAIDTIACKEPDENDPLYSLYPRVIKKDQWDACITALVESCTDDALIQIINEYKDVLYDKYKEGYGAQSVHHAFKGGLLNHTYELLHMLEGLYPMLPSKIHLEQCVIAIMFHDFGKLQEYKEGDGSIEKTEHMFLLGHIYISANYLNNILKDKNIDVNVREKIIHCVLAHHGQLEFGSPVIPCTVEAQIVNYLDNISAKLNIFENSSNMEQVHALGTTVVK